MLNKVILIGNLGKDPFIRYLDNNIVIAKFSLATTEKRRTKEGAIIETTDWHNIVLWGNNARNAEKYLKKGSQIYVEGKIHNKSYEDKSGVKKYVTEIHGDSFKVLNNWNNPEEEKKEDKNIDNNDLTIDKSPDDGLPF